MVAVDESRRLAGSNFDQAIDLVRRFRSKSTVIYAIGQEPWLGYINPKPSVQCGELATEPAKKASIRRKASDYGNTKNSRSDHRSGGS